MLVSKIRMGFKMKRTYGDESYTEQVKIEEILHASQVLKDVVRRTPLHKDNVLSAMYKCNVYLKREDLQIVRSFKIRGAYHFIRSLARREACARRRLCQRRQSCAGRSLYMQALAD